MTGIFEALYILYPRGSRTGGPEALHQLAASLRAAGQNAVLVPRPDTAHLPRVESYDRYQVPERDEVEDLPGRAVVASETSLHLLGRYRRATRFCWWLSVDNAPLFYALKRLQDHWDPRGRLVPPPVTARLAAVEAVGKNWLRGRYRLLNRVEHLTQSHYAQAFLTTVFGLPSTMISDYTEAVPPGGDAPAREPSLITYNPAKARVVTEVVRRRMPDLNFLPLEGLDTAGIRDSLLRSAVYLDLGYHPGKDRLPREAATLGAVSMAARRGSAAFDQDVPIPWQHKVPAPGDVASAAVSALRAVLDDLDAARQAQHSYRAWIAGERSRFDLEVSDAFVAGRLNSRGA